jgi:tRNA uracil 4-sulfurtransferase
MAPLVLVRYGELALKSPPVRREFESRLRKNILDLFVAAGRTVRLRSDRGHLYAEVDDVEAAVKILRRAFGVTSVSAVEEIPTDRVGIREKVGLWASPYLTAGASFAVRARRTGNHPFTSQELAREIGAEILTRYADRGLTVDLDAPDVELHVEVRGPRTYLYSDRVPGPGGLPLGVAGRLVALVDGPRGALGAYLMMKRGCRVSLVCPPSGATMVRDVLARFDPAASVTAVNEGTDAWRSTVLGVADGTHADGVVLPIGIDDYPAERAAWADRVLFSPTVGLTDDEVSERWTRVTRLAS